MRSVILVAALLPALLLPPPAMASEADFLASLAGSWQGTGYVMTRIGGGKFNVSCGLNVKSGAASLSMNGNCRGMVIVKRPISANITVKGQHYTGIYVGPSGMTSTLSGSRRGNAVHLSVRWAKVTNGDRDANMTIEKTGGNGLRLSTIDKDLSSGKTVVTSSIDLRRAR
jgi:hypothetical protein